MMKQHQNFYLTLTNKFSAVTTLLPANKLPSKLGLKFSSNFPKNLPFALSFVCIISSNCLGWEVFQIFTIHLKFYQNQQHVQE